MKIDKIIPGGQALATNDDGKKYFFWNALPGEEVTDYRVTKNKAHFVEAVATAINNPSPYRVQPKDGCFLSTSPWQIMSYDCELKTKHELVVEMFREQGIEISSLVVHTDGNEYFYRNKMEYSLYFDLSQDKILPAFHERGSHRKIPIVSSSIERPEIFQAATMIIDDLSARHEPAYKYQSLMLRANQAGEISGGLYENHQPHPVFPNLRDKILGYEYSYSPNGFFQINLPVYEMALKEIKKYITTDKVLDLYSGVGTIGLSVARDKDLTLVECNTAAFGEMVKNMSADSTVEKINDNLFKSRHISGVLSKSEDVLGYIAPDSTVILDPPRAGCEAKLIDKLLEVLPPTIIYLSCNPITQARDVSRLLSKYHVETVQVFNFFPHTPHIENLIVLSL